MTGFKTISLTFLRTKIAVADSAAADMQLTPETRERNRKAAKTGRELLANIG